MSDDQRRKLIQLWHELADSYEKLICQYQIFTIMANSLIDLVQQYRINNTEELKIMDLAAGTGLVSKLLIERLQISTESLYLIEPARKMCEHIEKTLPLIRLYEITAEDCLSIKGIPRCQFDFVLSNASMHLMSETDIYPIIAKLLKPKNSYFMYTLWGHAFDETKHYDEQNDFEEYLNKALAYYNYPEYMSTNSGQSSSSKRPTRSRKFLENVANHYGLQLQQCIVHVEQISREFDLDFMLMNNDWLMLHIERHRSNPCDDIQTVKSNIVGKLRELLRGKSMSIAFVNVIVSRME